MAAGAGILAGKEDNGMSERMLLNRVNKLKALEEQARAIEKQMEELKDEIKADMEAKGTEEAQAGDWIVRWSTVISSRLDSKALKAELPELAARFTRQTQSRRFSIV